MTNDEHEPLLSSSSNLLHEEKPEDVRYHSLDITSMPSTSSPSINAESATSLVATSSKQNRFGKGYLNFITWWMQYSISRDLLRRLTVRLDSMSPHQLTDESNLENAREIDHFISGTKIATQIIWPLAYIRFLTHDLMNHSKQILIEFNAELAKFLFWHGDNDHSILDQWPKSWVWPVSIAATMMFFGVVNFGLRNKKSEDQKKIEKLQYNIVNFSMLKELDDVDTAIIRTDEYQQLQIRCQRLESQEKALQAIRSESIFSSVDEGVINVLAGRAHVNKGEQLDNKELIHAEYEALKKKYVSVLGKKIEQAFQNKYDAINELSKLATNGGIYQSVVAINGLAYVLYELKKSRLAKFSKNYQSKVKALKDEVYTKLYTITKSDNNTLRRVAANYLLWKVGQPHQYRYDMAFVPIQLLRTYFKYRLWLSLFQFTAQYFTRKSVGGSSAHCNNLSESMNYLPQSGMEECSVCPPNEDVSYKNLFTAQGCIDDLLGVAQAPKVVVQTLRQILPWGIKHIDFSKQSWWLWSEVDLKNIFDLIAQSKSSTLDFVDLSCQTGAMASPLSAKQIGIISTFFERVGAREVSLKGCKFPVNGTAEVLKVLRNQTQSLDLSHMELGEQDASHLAAVLSYFSQLKRLFLSFNQLNDNALSILSPELAKLNLTELSVGGNRFSQLGIEAISTQAFPRLQRIDLSNLDLSQANLTSLAGFMKNPALTHFTFRENQVGDANIGFISVLSQTAIKYIDLSGNFITEDSSEVVGGALRNSCVETFIISNNQLGALGACGISGHINQTSLQTFVMSGNDISDAGFVCVMRKLSSSVKEVDVSDNGISAYGLSELPDAIHPNVSIAVFKIAKNPIGDDGVSYLFDAFDKVKSQLQWLGLSETEISSIKQVFVRAANTTTLLGLELGSNAFKEADHLAAIDDLPQTNLVHLNVSDTGATSKVGQRYANTFPKTQLTSFDGSNNYFDDMMAITLAENLVIPKPNEVYLTSESAPSNVIQAIHDSQSNTHLMYLDLSNNIIGTSGAFAICRVQSPANITMANLLLSGNPVSAGEVNLYSCYIPGVEDVQLSSGSRLMPPSIYYFVGSHFLRPIAVVFRQTDNIKTYKVITTSTQKALYEYAPDLLNMSLWLHIAAMILAFHEELGDMIKPTLPKSAFDAYRIYEESFKNEYLHIVTGFFIRIFAGSKAITYELVHSTKKTVKKGDKLTTNVAIELATKSLLLMASAGISYAITWVTNDPSIGTMLLPIFFKTPAIAQCAYKEYQRHGIFSAIDKALEETAYSVPFGEYLRQKQH